FFSGNIKHMIFPVFWGWFVAYLLPVMLVFGTIFVFSGRAGTAFRMIVVHAGLCLSILLSQYFIYSSGRSFPWIFSPFSVLLFVIATTIISALLGRFGFLYAISSLIQQV